MYIAVVSMEKGAVRANLMLTKVPKEVRFMIV
jgi:hypothetical protein